MPDVVVHFCDPELEELSVEVMLEVLSLSPSGVVLVTGRENGPRAHLALRSSDGTALPVNIRLLILDFRTKSPALMTPFLVVVKDLTLTAQVLGSLQPL